MSRLYQMAVNSLSPATWRYRWEKLQIGRFALADRVGAKSGWASRRVRWPVPLRSPAYWREVHVMRIGGVGDALMGTPALRALRRRHPSCRIVYYTLYPELFRGLGFVDESCHLEEFGHRSAVVAQRLSDEEAKISVDHVAYHDAARAGRVNLTYEHSIPPGRHIARIHGDHLDVEVRDVRPQCVIPREDVERLDREWSGLPRPRVVLNRAASPTTRNKEWMPEYWDALVSRFLEDMTVIDIGATAIDDRFRGHPHHIDLRGKTRLLDLVPVMAAADLHVGPVSGPMHIAAAVAKPSVVLYGGYEPPHCTAYPGNVNLSTALPCSPCWLLGPCPYDRKCMRQIPPERVEAEVRALWDRLRGVRGARDGAEVGSEVGST
ncbi:MAG: glycosyltransferase family 9 protein [Isosphaeraceae bacterium]